MQFEWNLLLADMQNLIRSFCYDTTAEILLGLTCQWELAIFLAAKEIKDKQWEERDMAEIRKDRARRVAENKGGRRAAEHLPSGVFESNPHFLDFALREGHLRFVTWSLAGSEARGEYPLADRKSFYEVIKRGHLDLLKWLVEEGFYNPLNSDSSGVDHYIGLFWASHSGQLALLQYIGKLVMKSPFPGDNRKMMASLIRGAILYERLNFLSWLYVRRLLFSADMDKIVFQKTEKISLASQQCLSARGFWRPGQKEEEEVQLSGSVIPGGLDGYFSVEEENAETQ